VRENQSVGPSIHPAYSIYSYSLFGQKKLPCIDDLTANDELTNSHNLTCFPWGWAAEGSNTHSEN
jgi:hypothetical protein